MPPSAFSAVPCQPDPLPYPTPPAPLPCTTPASFVSNETVLVDGANGKVYVLAATNVAYTAASSACSALGTSTGTLGTLVCYGSYAENYLVESYFSRTGVLGHVYWMGLRQPSVGSGSW